MLKNVVAFLEYDFSTEINLIFKFIYFVSCCFAVLFTCLLSDRFFHIAACLISFTIGNAAIAFNCIISILFLNCSFFLTTASFLSNLLVLVAIVSLRVIPF